MKPYHSVAMYNQAIQMLELSRNPHHPPHATLVQRLHSNYHFFNQLLLEIITEITESLFVSKAGTLKCTQNST